MNGMPLFILAYLNVTSKDFLQILYGNLPGAAVMTLVLGIYVMTVKLSERILDIRV